MQRAETDDAFKGPSQFFNFEGHSVELSDIRELNQGGPERGYLHIDSVSVSEHLFGLNILHYDGFLYCPIHRPFKGFVLCAICMASRRIIESGIQGSNIKTVVCTGDGMIVYIIDGQKKKIPATALVWP